MKKTLLAILLLSFAEISFSQYIGTGPSHHNIVTKDDGSVYTWGLNFYGQLGNGNNTDSNVPLAIVTSGVLSGKTITQVTMGWFHSIALASDGTVYTWGDNNFGQLGNGNNTDSNVPVAVDMSGVLNGKTITQVVAQDGHSIALASDGTVYTWGWNFYGQLGNGTHNSSNVPVAVTTSGILNGKIITQVAAGALHSIVLASDGTVYTWGRNSDGQLGNGTNTDSSIPVAVVTSGVLNGKTITQVTGGGDHSIALASEGTVYTWGRNSDGQLGNGNNTNRNVPVAVITSGVLLGKTITQTAAGAIHSIALASDGTVYTWGYNGDGQLGNGNNIDSNVPVAVDQSVMGFLPVELTNFAGAWTNSGSVVLNWQTATEINNYGFEIERSLTPTPSQKEEAFEVIGFVPGFGTTTEPKGYSFVDENLPTGTYQYRLKQIDFDGSFEYSNTVEVEISVPTVFSLEQNYPNPFNPSTTISFSIPERSFVMLKVYDMLGRKVAVIVNEELETGSFEKTFEASSLASGVYIYSITAMKEGKILFNESKQMLMLK